MSEAGFAERKELEKVLVISFLCDPFLKSLAKKAIASEESKAERCRETRPWYH